MHAEHSITKNGAKCERVLKGVPASPGIAMGTAYLYAKEIPRVEMRTINDADKVSFCRLSA